MASASNSQRPPPSGKNSNYFFCGKNMSLKLDYVIREYQIKEVLLFYDNPVISASKNVKGRLY